MSFNGARNELLKGLAQSIFADADLDRGFPIGDWADQNVIDGIFNKLARSRRERVVTEHKPEPCVSVQEELHFMYSEKSFRCSSSSVTIANCPLHAPNFGFGLSAARGRSSAMGF